MESLRNSGYHSRNFGGQVEVINVVDEDLHINTSLTTSRVLSAVSLIGIAIIASFGVVGITKNITSQRSSVVNADKSVSELTSAATLRRLSYDPHTMFQEDKPNFVNYKILSTHKALIEPHAPMVLEISNPVESSNYLFSACEISEDGTVESSNCYEGALLYSSWDGEDAESESLVPVTIPCEPYDTFSITVSEYDASDDTLLAQSVFTSLCIYVRRDIASLTASDLNETMDAMHSLWEYTEEEGQQQFGENFHAALYFSEAHFFSAAQRDSDHIHEGLGFVPQHIKFTSLFEQAMQAVNPKVTIPYWELTKEAPANISIYESIMFSPRTFGSLTRPKDPSRGFTYELDKLEDGIIPDGRWAGLKADANTRMPTIPTSYGYMRSPWNLNPAPYITRYTTENLPLPSCHDYLNALAFENPIEFISAVQKGPHAALHAVIGNVFGCDLLDQLDGLLRDDTAKASLCRQWSYFMKDLFRDTFYEPRTDCEVDSNSPLNDFKCGYTCNQAMSKEMIPALKAMFGKDYASSTASSAQWLALHDFICTGDGYKLVVGAHMDSTSASDPSFWPAHPTQERLVHAQLMSLQYTGDFDWESDYICDTNKCYSETTGTKDYHDQCCYGHNRDDRWLDFVTPDRYSFIGLTNIDVMRATSPLADTYSMPYVYEHFDYDHCDELHDVGKYLEDKYLTVAGS